MSQELVVRFAVIGKGEVVDKKFTSYIACRNFVNKLRHSKKLRLISHPNFNN